MIKAGIFLDLENLKRNGGWGIQYDVIRQLAEAQAEDSIVLRANAYLAIDAEREDSDRDYRERNEDYRAAIRRNGFHLILKEVKRYYNYEDNETIVKANADLDLAVDALLQSENLDYILIGTGDGDFLRLVRALQNRGKRVDLLSFANTSSELRKEVDNHFVGFLIPGILRGDDWSDNRRLRGVMHKVNEEQGYGFITVRTALGANDLRYDIFCHISDFTRHGRNLTNEEFGELKVRSSVLEFDIREGDRGTQAKNIIEFNWNDRT